MTDAEFVALEGRVSKNFDFLLEQELRGVAGSKHAALVLKWEALLTDYEIELDKRGVTRAPT